MAKKQNKPIKACADCIHEFACRGWTGGRYISDDTASQCPNHETVKESGAYLCGVLDERKRKKTNADRIRAMSDEELNDLFNEIYNAGVEDAVSYEWGQRTNSFEWTMEWLQQPAEEGDNETVEEQKDGDGNG